MSMKETGKNIDALLAKIGGELDELKEKRESATEYEREEIDARIKELEGALESFDGTMTLLEGGID